MLLDEFKNYLKTMRMYNLASSRIYWDMYTGSTPKKAIPRHVEANTFFRMKAFEMSTAPAFGRMLEELSKPSVFESLDPAWQMTVRNRMKQFERFSKLPPEFYAKMQQDRGMAGRVWEKAKQTNDFASFAPYLKTEIENEKQRVKYLAPNTDPYDFLLDASEEGMSMAYLDDVFGGLAKELRPMIPKIMEQQKGQENALAGKTFDVAHEKAACLYLLQYMGYDMEAGGMAEVEHPLTMGTDRNDVRVSDHFYENDGLSPLFSIIHEGGHGIFNQGVAPEYADTDVEHIHHMGLHESQSRFYENMLGRSEAFWQPIYGDIQKLMPELQDVSLEAFSRESRRVRPGMIRTKADEVTYCMHIILRYELEKKLFHDELAVEDLPKAWGDAMETYLGIRPATDTEGVLQDLHWSSGYLGYFPTYLLGSLYDGMFLEALERDMGPADEILAKGEILKITGWLNEKIHRFGGLYSSKEVLQRVCGKDLEYEPLVSMFAKRYKI